MQRLIKVAFNSNNLNDKFEYLIQLRRLISEDEEI